MSTTSESLSLTIIAILGAAILTGCGSESSSSKTLDTTTESIRDVRRDESSAKTQQDSLSPEVPTDGTADSQSERDATPTKPNPRLASKVIEALDEGNSRSNVSGGFDLDGVAARYVETNEWEK
jgi:type II secretory pathway pseudopilin PulG